MICHVKIEIYRRTSIRQKCEVKKNYCVFILKITIFSAEIEGLYFHFPNIHRFCF